MNGKKLLVVMGLGPDRVGLVAHVTRFIRERGGNVEDSRMASLGAEFGIMVLVSGAEEQLARLESDAAALSEAGLQVLIRRTSKSADAATPRLRAVVTTEALDHEGIVHAVSSAIERLGVNIVSLETSSYHAPLSGGPLFRIEARLDLPGALGIDGLRKGLADVADSENLELHVEAIEAR